MPTLDWIGKKAVLNHHNEVPFHLLREVSDLSVGDPGTGNLLVEGDNLLALKALLPYYAGQVKCIYIDPPYNTGNESWVYNDNVNSPEIRKWLGKVVGGELEDLSRHDKWLCMIYPRLQIAARMLAKDGLIFISIDDNELHYLISIMNEIFGENNHVSTIIWRRKRGRDNSAKFFSKAHEYIVVYAKHIEQVEIFNLEIAEETKKAYRNPDDDPRGRYRLLGCWARGTQGGSKYSFVSKNGKRFSERLWLMNKDSLTKLDLEDKLNFVGDKVYRRHFLTDHKGNIPETIWDDVSNVANASDEIKELFGSQVFDTPKPTPLIKRCLQVCTKGDDVIMDFFSGSGTTGQAVLELNEEDNSSRRFVLVEMEPKICCEITAQRLRKVSKGFKSAKGEKKEGLGNGFQYCRLGPACFDEFGRINEAVTFAELARHVFFAETGTPAPKQPKANNPLIGLCKETAIFLLYNGVLKDKKINGGNVLTHEVLRVLPEHSGPKVIFGTACRLSAARLKQENIIFRQIPYQIKGR